MFALRNRVFATLQSKLGFDTFDTLKLILSTSIFFCIIGSYSVLRSLKTSVFLGLVGKEYEPFAKIIAILITIPTIIIHAKIIDRFKKHQTVHIFLAFYAIICALFAYVFAHPVYGLSNTLTSPYRVTGWAFEISMDLFQALVVGTFWSFLNSICTPPFAEKGYGFIVAGSRIGGIITTFLSWILLEKTPVSSNILIPILTICSGVLLLLSMYCIKKIMFHVPSSHMHGYEASYVVEKNDEKKNRHTGTLEGLKLILTEPYVLGIFCLVFSYEVINIIFDYQMHVLMSVENNNEIGNMSSFMLLYTCTFQLLSFLFAVFGTPTLIKRLGITYSLLIMPLVTIVLAVLPVFYPKLITIFIVMVVLRACNYGFNHPLREILFIPTTMDIRFKSKAWIESFGRTFAKTTGSTFNLAAILSAPYLCILIESCFSLVLAVIWAFLAFAVGKKYARTILQNSVIGKRK